MRLSVSAILISLTCAISICAAATLSVPIDPRIANAKKLLQLTGGTSIAVQVMDQYIEKNRREHSDIPEEVWKEVKGQLKPESLGTSVALFYLKYYSNDELEQLIHFYESPLGVKTVQNLPQITNDTVKAVIVLMQYGPKATETTLGHGSKEIVELIRLTGGSRLASETIQKIADKYSKEGSQIPAKVWETLKQRLNETDLAKILIPVYQKYYTSDEISQLIAFYESPIGKKTVEVQPDLVRDTLRTGKQYGQDMAELAMKLKEKALRCVGC